MNETLSREQPWHLRRSTAKHEQIFRNLVEFHELTTAWLSELQADHPERLLTRGLSSDVTENLWMLESLSETSLDALLDDTMPEDTLARLDRTVWTMQSWTLSSILEKTPKADREALESQLNQISWKSGRACAERRWKNLPEEARGRLNVLVQAARDTPILASGSGPASDVVGPLLLRRALPSEVQVELLFCPHRSPYAEVAASADSLCALHTQWMRGFAYGLNHRIAIETPSQAQTQTRCQQRWFFL